MAIDKLPVREECRNIRGLKQLFEWHPDESDPDSKILNDKSPEEFLAYYQRLILKLANKFVRKGIEASPEQLVERGWKALHKAIHKYRNMSYKTKFSTYAYGWISGLMNQRDPEDQALSFESFIPEETDHEETLSLLDVIPSRERSPEMELAIKEMWHIVDTLPQNLKAIIYARYVDGKTQPDIAVERVCTKQNVQDLERRAIRMLREKMDATFVA